MIETGPVIVRDDRKRRDVGPKPDPVSYTHLDVYKRQVLCEPRLIGKSYGRTFLDSLPPFARTRSIDDGRGFFAEPWPPPDPEPAA